MLRCWRGDGVWELKCGGGVGKCWGARKFWGGMEKGVEVWVR